MSSNITLSAGVRQNLLSLQNTADLMATTQNRLATGKKVNSALDNPTNFFTASSLQARSNDLSTLLDGMSNGIKTLEAADNGITSISKTIQSMQALVRQARAEKSAAPTGTPAGNAVVVATGATSISTAGGSGTPPGNAVVTATGPGSIDTTGGPGTPPENAVATATGPGSVDASLADVTFEVNGQLVTLTAAGGTAGVYDSDDLAAAINTQVGVSASVNATVDGGGNLVVTSTGTAGIADAVTIDTFSAGTDATDLGFAGATVTENGSAAVPGTPAPVTFEVNGQQVTLSTTGGASGVYNTSAIAAAINAQVGTSASVNATVNGSGNLVVTSTGTAGTTDAVTIDTFSAGTDATDLGFAGTTATDNGSAAIPGAAAPITFDVNGEQVTLSTTGGAAGVYDAAAVAAAINAQVGTSAGVNATVNTGGRLTITSTGTAGTADTVTVNNFSTGDATSLGFATASATDSGSAAIPAPAGSESDGRASLRAQFNELINQLNSFSEDASFNGINLLAGDKLKISFDEKGENTIEILSSLGTGVEGAASAVDATNLGITSQTDWTADATLDTLLTGLGASLTSLRSQASSFGTNLAVVQNRTDFTKAMMNTLQTGADKLVLADTNEEAANMLALQTRQQLSSTALSLASQADQAALRLF